MKKTICVIAASALLIFQATFAQQQSTGEKPKHKSLGFGIKGGLNFANVTGTSSINNSSRTGFMAGVFLAPASKKLLSYRTEIIFSRQGYDFKTNTQTGAVNLNYIIMPHLIGINITKFVQLQ